MVFNLSTQYWYYLFVCLFTIFLLAFVTSLNCFSDRQKIFLACFTVLPVVLSS